LKRLIIASLMLIFLLLTGCAKDEVGAPGDNAGEPQSEELADNAASNDTIDEKEDNGSEKETSADNQKKAGEVSTEASQKDDSSDNQSVQANTTNTPAQSKQSDQTAKEKQTKPSQQENNQAKQTKEKTSPSNDQKEEEEKPVQREEDASPPKQDPPKEPEKPKQTVTITIAAPDVKGTILSATTVEMAEGDTVLAITQKIAKAKGIQMSVRGAGATAYVEGIDNLFEFDHGPMSGWEASVDGKTLDKSAGIYGIKPGQAIKWHYTKNYTE
jgi:FtsZ-interacting cell division protein ZipA